MTKEKLFITQEVGSLAKPNWRVKAVAGEKITPVDLDDAERWGKRLRIDSKELLEELKKSEPDKQAVRNWATFFAVRLQEEAGLDVIYDGEQNRSEMYQHAVSRSKGFELRGLVRSFDNKYYQKYACIEKPGLENPWHTGELKKLQELTGRQIKVPVTGAYTIAAWSFDEYYAKSAGELGTPSGGTASKEARRHFILDVARNLIRPNIEDLLKNGATRIQIDEPAATTIPTEAGLFVDSFNESVRGLPGELSVHICYSDYNILFPEITRMENCSEYSLELANRDPRGLGTRDEDRTGYAILKKFRSENIPGRIALGVVDIHSDFVESPELIRDRILYASDLLGDLAKIHPSPDCGLRTRSWEIAFNKLTNLVKGTRLAEEAITGKYNQEG